MENTDNNWWWVWIAIILMWLLILTGCTRPKGTWKVEVKSDGYYEIWSGGEVVSTRNGPKTFYLDGPPYGSDDFPFLAGGWPGQMPGNDKGFGFKHTDGKSAVICPFFCSTCEKIK